jgi:putative FmdB family regulatory protein
MPIYEYRCAACGFQQEYLQRLSEPPHTKCPKCGKKKFNKMVTAAGFQLKGTGWYATDFKNSGSKPAAESKSKEKSADGAGKDAAAKEAPAKDSSSKSDSKKTSSAAASN